MTSREIRDSFEDELSVVKLDKSHIEEFARRIRDNYVGAHSIVGDSMTRSAQNFAKTIVQKTISTKRGNDGKNEHISSVTTTKEILNFSKKRSINRGWLWLVDEYDDEEFPIPRPISDSEKISKKIFSISLKYLLKSATVEKNSKDRFWDTTSRNGEIVVLNLDVSRMIQYEITMFEVYSSVSAALPGVEMITSPLSVGKLEIFPSKSNFKTSLASYANKIVNISSKIHISGIPGVLDVEVETRSVAPALRECYKSFHRPGYWRFPLAKSILISEYLRVEDAIYLMKKVFPDVEYDEDVNYFYVRSKSNPISTLTDAINQHPEWVERHAVAVELEGDKISSLISSLLSDHRFNPDRAVFNELRKGFATYGVEFSMQWCTVELREVSDENTDFHTHHPILEKNFALGYPTPVTEKGNRERGGGLFPSITFGSGEDSIRRAGIEQTFDKNDNVYSCHMIGSPAPFGSNMRLGMEVPYVSVAGEISEQYKIDPYIGAVAKRLGTIDYKREPRDYTEGHQVKKDVVDVDLEVHEFVPTPGLEFV